MSIKTTVEWIDATKEKPDYDRAVLVAYDDGIGVYVAQWKLDHWEPSGYNCHAWCNISFWADIPDNPNYEKAKDQNEELTNETKRKANNENKKIH